MTKPKLLIAAAAAVLATSAAQADVVIHITGSTAFRSGTVTAIQTLMGGTGNYKAAYGSTSGTGTTSSNRAVIQGSISSVPSAGVVTFKCSWSGSTGGIKTVVQNLDVTTWPSITNLPVTNTVSAIADASLSFALDTSTFPTETAKADVTMEDTTQAATGFTSTTLTETRVGVIPFEWIAGNGSPAGLDNITALLAQAAISGGAPVSLFTGNPSDLTPVYVVGRNFDSGTRLACLTNSGLSPFSTVQHVQVATTGTQGTAGSSINTLKLYSAETVLSQAFTIGNSGYSSGSFVADVLATPGAATATTTTGVPVAEQLLFGAGHLVGFLGRSDAARACRTSAIATNNAHRMKFNGVSIINGTALNADGTPVGGYNDALIKEGSYTLWEFQNLAYRQSYSGAGKLVADALAANITANVPATSGIKLADMHVTKSIEGGVVTSTQL